MLCSVCGRVMRKKRSGKWKCPGRFLHRLPGHPVAEDVLTWVVVLVVPVVGALVVLACMFGYL